MEEINFMRADIERVIFHEISQKKKGQESAEYICHDKITPLTNNVLSLIRDRLVDALGQESNSFSVHIDPDSLFKKDVDEIFETDNDNIFIAKSKSTCQRLAKLSPTRYAACCFLFLQGKFKDTQFIAVIKADKTEALSSDGNQIKLLTNMFLPEAKRVFKIGVISQNKKLINPNKAFLYDDQALKNSVAKYFYKDLLGFDITKNAKIITKKFYEETLNLISKNSNGYDEMSKFKSALITELFSNDTQINLKKFSTKYLNGNVKNEFESKIIANNKFPQTFAKDITSIKRRFKQNRLKFEDIVLSGPRDKFDINVKILTDKEIASIEVGDNKTIIQINGEPTFL